VIGEWRFVILKIINHHSQITNNKCLSFLIPFNAKAQFMNRGYPCVWNENPEWNCHFRKKEIGYWLFVNGDLLFEKDRSVLNNKSPLTIRQ